MMYIVDGIANQNEKQEKKLILFLQTCNRGVPVEGCVIY